jgi:hypothetical protein
MDNNRLLLVLEKTIKDINREVINTKFKNLTIENIKPSINLAARARADYLKELFDVASEFPDALPPAERIAKLRDHRVRYEELISASQALETAIQRKYLDVLP